ncbi:MAG: hypothetical protein N4A35_16610 [Flavobacteriales bacterium]|jgi:hypothetical protein|nr:hypothetical protein [Flavobacteriales bacterium]
MKKIVFVLTTLSLIIGGCKKKEIALENLKAPVLDPSFALPIGYANLNLGDIERELDVNNFVYNDNSNLFEIIYRDRIFELSANDVIQIPTQNYSTTYTMPVANQTALVGGGAGFTTSYTQQSAITFNVANGAQLDSVIIQSGSLTIDLSSDFMHSATVNLTIPSLMLNGTPLQQTLNVNYAGSTPVLDNANIDLAGYTIDLTNGGMTNNSFNVTVNFQVTSSGNPIAGTEQMVLDMQLDVNAFDAIWGYLGQVTNILSQDTSNITMFDDLAGGQVHFEDPRIHLTIGNTAGLEVQTQFSAVFAPDNSTNVNLGGAGLTSLPLITRANNPGDTTITYHTIDNNNTSPTLSDVLDEGPGEIVYTSSATSNPSGFANNFVLGDALVWCEAEVVLPIFGWARDFTLADTTDLDVADALGIDSTSNLTVEDVEQALLRIIVDNGLPVDAGLQLYFADTNFVVIDSLFNVPGGIENVFEHGIVDFTLPLTDPNHGKVTQSTRTITDVAVSQALIKKLINGNAKKLIYKTRGLTNDAYSGQNVKIFPEYDVDIKVSAKIDFNIDLED